MASGSKRQVIVVDDAAAIAETAAKRVIAGLQAAGDRPAVCLTGGSSPDRLYRLLTEEQWRSQVPWDRVHWFMGDDRFVPESDELSNMGKARRLLLEPMRVPRGHIHAIPTDANYPEGAARLYEEDLKTFYGPDRLDPARPLFDLVLMGLGPDGHTASLFPNFPAADEKERWVVGVPKAHVAPFVPRVTLTFPALGATREMLFQVDGADKRDILHRVLSGEDLPAGRAHADGDLVWVIDRAAAAEAPHVG